MMTNTLFTLICITLLVVAALHDLIARTIPNPVPALLAGAGLLSHLATGDAGTALLAASAVGVLSGLCWLGGWLGGGDVKLLAGAALALPTAHLPVFVCDIAVAGGLLAAIYLLARRLPAAVVGGAPGHGVASLPRRAWRAECWRVRRGGPLPYAVAIAGAGIFVLLQGGSP
jgi:prepilin peptidase CpaA